MKNIIEIPEVITADDLEAWAIETPEPGTPEAAIRELARRRHNKAAKAEDSELERLEAESEWAFTTSGPDLKAIAGVV